MERVNKILSKLNKKIIIYAGIFFLIIIISFGLLKTSLNIIFPGNEISFLIKESFKDSFGKAIKFDSFYFKYNGDIVLLNFYLSNTTDFNDNINLVKCNEIVIDTNIISMLARKISFSGVYMNNPEITIIKNYGKDYHDIIADHLTSGIDSERLKHFIKNGFKIKVQNAKGTFRDIFKNGKTCIEFENLDILIKYKNDKLSYYIKGDLLSKDKSFFNKGDISLKGETHLITFSSRNHIKLNNFDLLLLDDIIRQSELENYFFGGFADFNIYIASENTITSFNGSLDINNLKCVKNDEKSSYIICNNEDISCKFNIAVSRDLHIIKAENICINDSVFKLESAFSYETDKLFSLNLLSNKIVLDDLSENISLFPGCRYSGILQLNSNVLYKLDEKKPETLSVNIKLENFNINPDNNTISHYMFIKNCNINFGLTETGLLLHARLKTGESDLDVKLDSSINTWTSICSDTRLDIISSNLELDLLTKGVKSLTEYAYNEAYADMLQNFAESSNFLLQPEGIFINNNNFTVNINAGKLLIKGDAALNNFSMSLALVKGIVKTNRFTLDGYSGVFALDFYGSFRQAIPYIKLEGSVKDIDLGAISKDSFMQDSMSGIMSCDFKIQTNAGRFGQIMETGNASVNIDIKNGTFKNNSRQYDLQTNLVLNGYMVNTLTDISFDSLYISFVQAGSTFSFRNCRLSGPSLTISGYGKYDHASNGIDLPVTLQINEGGVLTRVPLLLYGSLVAPCVKINNETSKGCVCF